jgi:hypothetical protein
MKIRDYADLFAQNGYWRYKRAEKKKYYTGKSMVTKDAVMKNLPLTSSCGINSIQRN